MLRIILYLRLLYHFYQGILWNSIPDGYLGESCSSTPWL